MMTDQPHEYRGFDTIPEPSSPQQAELATKLGMVLLAGMKDIINIEKFSALPGMFRSEVCGDDGAAWLITMERA